MHSGFYPQSGWRWIRSRSGEHWVRGGNTHYRAASHTQLHLGGNLKWTPGMFYGEVGGNQRTQSTWRQEFGDPGAASWVFFNSMVVSLHFTNCPLKHLLYSSTPWSDPELGLYALCGVSHVFQLCIHVDFLQVLWFHTTSQKHSGRSIS